MAEKLWRDKKLRTTATKVEFAGYLRLKDNVVLVPEKGMFWAKRTSTGSGEGPVGMIRRLYGG
jgi:hypothetical protein